MNERGKHSESTKRAKKGLKPSEQGPGPGECEPVSMDPKPGGRRGPECPEGYPEEQPSDRPEAKEPAQQAKKPRRA